MKKIKCPMCGGNGYRTILDHLSDGGIHAYDKACSACNGTGKIDILSYLAKKIKES